jgi:hypothetical protein
MADVRFRVKSDVLPIRVESGRLVLPDTIGSLIENMYLTPEGTLRSIWGPTPYVPNYGAGYYSYDPLKGIFHTRMWEGGQREVLLIQAGNKIKVFQGWAASSGAPWADLIAPTGAEYNADIGADQKPRFPCQFESTPNGVVIIPAGESSRAFFYDGRVVLPLGYSMAPNPPSGWSGQTGGLEAYNHTGKTMANATTPGWGSITGGAAGVALEAPLPPPYMYGNSRLGTVDTSSVQITGAGRVLKSSYRAAVQWVDLWGNLSPLSGRSSSVVFAGVPAEDPQAGGGNTTPTDHQPYVANGEDAGSYLGQTFWSDIQPGPTGTVARVLCRTQDELNSGTQKLFEVPAYASHGFLSKGTISDNVTEGIPDNAPDSWLTREPPDPVAVTPFKLYKMGFGRGWAANFADDPGKIHPSMPGRWGTFLDGEEIYPDPRGAEVTGLCHVPEGMLVFTESTSFLIVISYGGEGFQTQTIHPTIGCVAPSSIATMPDGTAVWLGKEGFYGYKEEKVFLVSEPIKDKVKRFNRARLLQSVAAFDVREGKYRCWVPMNGSRQNNMCFSYDGEGWTQRSDVEAAAVCTTQDHRSYMLTGGEAKVEGGGGAGTQGVWLLDHQVSSWTPLSRAGMVRTSWLRAPASKGRGSPMTIYLWFREMESGTLDIEVERDWRVGITQTATATLHATDDIPPFWNTARYAGTDADGDALTWKKRRPYWTRADISVPSAEVFRLTITHQGAWEFVGMAFDEVPKPDSFRSEPR